MLSMPFDLLVGTVNRHVQLRELVNVSQSQTRFHYELLRLEA